MSESIEELKKIIQDQKSEINRLSKDYNAFFKHTRIGVIYLDKNGNYIEVNDKFCEIVGYTKEELLQHSFKDITFHEDLEKDIKIFEGSKKDGTDSFILEKRYIKKDGSLIHSEIFINHVRNEKNEIEYTIGVITDITKRKKIQNTIIEQTKTMQMYLDIVDVMIIALDKSAVITLVNRKACEVLGFEEYELLGRNWYKNYVTKESRDESLNYFNDILEKKIDLGKKFTNDIETKSGKRTISWRNKIIKDSEKNIIGIVSSGEDVTEILKLEEDKKRNEKVLHNQSKLASMGEMLRNIAHQWRQPLSTISTAASGIKIQKELDILKDEEFEKGMEMIVNTTQYLSQTIDDFQNYFKIDSKAKEFTCESLFTNISNLLISNFKSRDIKLVIKDETSNKSIHGLFNELLQVLVNIINNSLDAFLERNYDNRVVIVSAIIEDNLLNIKIKDNAGGIPSNILNRIFEPYFTTKHQSLGTGIGLYMAKDIVENRLSGFLEVDNELTVYNDTKRDGASFKIKIPVSL